MAEKDRIPTNLRTLLILEVVATRGAAMTATEINASLGLPKQTVHRLCNTLEEEGFLVRETDGKRFRPSRRLRILGSGLLNASRAHIARHQVLQSVAAQVRETVNFVVPEETGMSYLDRVETDWPFRVQLPIGSTVPFHCTASGKTFMASLPEPERRAFVAALDLAPLTAMTHRNGEVLLEDLSQIAERGYALDNEEFVEGMVAIAVPVRDPEGRFIAALAFHGPNQRLDIPGMVARKEVLLEGARKLTDALFAPDSQPQPA